MGLKSVDSSTQVVGDNDAGRSCPLCNIPDKEIVQDFPRWRLARTKTMKRHKERLMLFHKEHVRTLDDQSIGEAYMLLMTIGRKYFSYTNQWAILEPIFATVPDHWHRVASDLDADAEDHAQILRTPRIIIENQKGAISTVTPAEKMSPEVQMLKMISPNQA